MTSDELAKRCNMALGVVYRKIRERNKALAEQEAQNIEEGAEPPAPPSLTS